MVLIKTAKLGYTVTSIEQQTRHPRFANQLKAMVIPASKTMNVGLGHSVPMA